ncbi:MAG TPA: hypothetical protein PKB06_06275, partial [Actinotalea sp.]|nr:hypothetical protein [Actinotalea sp.]
MSDTSPEGRRVGPVLLRRGQVPATTTDQRLLAHNGGAEWVHADPWRVMRIQSEFVEGFGALAEVGPAVSVCASAQSPRPDARSAAGPGATGQAAEGVIRA